MAVCCGLSQAVVKTMKTKKAAIAFIKFFMKVCIKIDLCYDLKLAKLPQGAKSGLLQTEKAPSL